MMWAQSIHGPSGIYNRHSDKWQIQKSSCVKLPSLFRAYNYFQKCFFEDLSGATPIVAPWDQKQHYGCRTGWLGDLCCSVRLCTPKSLSHLNRGLDRKGESYFDISQCGTSFVDDYIRFWEFFIWWERWSLDSTVQLHGILISCHFGKW